MPLTNTEHFERLNRWTKDPEYLASHTGPGRYDFGALVGQKWEIEEKTYWYFLEVLPPVGMKGGGFYMSEFLTGDITSYYSKVGNKYFHEYRRAPARVQWEAMA